MFPTLRGLVVVSLLSLPAVAVAGPAHYPVTCGVPAPKPDPSTYAGSDAAAQQPKYQQQAAALQALSAAAIVVLGHQPKPVESDNWIGVMQRPDSPYHDKYFAKELDFTDGTTFLRTCLKSVAGSQAQLYTIDAAFWQARGRASTGAERATYLPQVASGNAWYATIVLAEKQKAAAGTPALKLPPGGLPQLPPQSLPSAPKP